MTPHRIGFFTRILDQATPVDRYRNALAQVRQAEALGFDTVWVAQHHFRSDEGGMPSPLVFLAATAQATTRIRLATGVITLPYENPVRVAEDASVLDVLSGRRLEIGVGSGGATHPGAAPDGDAEQRRKFLSRNLDLLRDCLRGLDLGGDGTRVYPPTDGLDRRIWQATFSERGAEQAGRAGDGLMLSKTQPRTADEPRASLTDLQLPLVEAYLDALPEGVKPRILASRSVFVADERGAARQLAALGLARAVTQLEPKGMPGGDTLDERIRRYDVHVGAPDDVAASLAADAVLRHATEVSVQVHPVDPPHDDVMRSLELFATRVAPALGWKTEAAQASVGPA